MEKTMDKIVALAKNRGFVYAGSEIYGGLSNTWDYGPLGVEFKNNVKKAWWKKFVQDVPLQCRPGRCDPDEPPGSGWLPVMWAASLTPSSTARPVRPVTVPTSSSRSSAVSIPLAGAISR